LRRAAAEVREGERCWPPKSKVVFMVEGRTVEASPPEEIFDHPQQARTREFIDKILRH
jgi:ABC-type histidine transport system ATPase subunit